MSLSPKQTEVLMILAARGPQTLDEIKDRAGGRHGATQALNALIDKGKVTFDEATGKYRRR